MTAVVYVNGKITDAREATVPVFDHGFLYGEGVYETLRTYAREPFLFEAHMRRLRNSAALMALEVPWADETLLARVRETLAEADRIIGRLDEAYIRMLLTRGVGELTYHPSATPVPTLVIIVKPFPAPAEHTFSRGIGVALVQVRRNHPQALNPMIKSNNLMNNALAMQEAYRKGGDEALMQNQAGEIVECSQSNFFAVFGGELVTAPVTAGLLPGITRQFVIDLAHDLGLAVRERAFTAAELQTAEEAFITGTTREVTPVVRVDDRAVGSGTPGPISQRLLAEFRKRVTR